MALDIEKDKPLRLEDFPLDVDRNMTPEIREQLIEESERMIRVVEAGELR